MPEYIIAANVKTVDGGGNFSHVQPGDTLVISEDRGVLRLANLVGTQDAPIIITVKGPITIDAAGAWLCIDLYNCQHVRLTGENDTVDYGIRCVNFSNCGVFARKGTRWFEIDHLEIGPGAGEREAGIRARSDIEDVGDNWIQHGTHIHHNYIHHIPATAMYIGTTIAHGATPLKGVYIHHNRITDIGREGVQLRNTLGDVEVHHNHIERVGLDEPPPDMPNQSGAGLSIESLATGKWYSNTVLDSTQGAIIHEAGEGLEVYNNVFVRCGYHIERGGGGIHWFASHDGIQVYNNTVVGGKDFGIRVSRNVRGKLFNNFVVASPVSLADDQVQAVCNLQIEQIEDARFVDPAHDDYRVEGGSPAVGAASSELFPPTDMDGRARPVGPRPDVGAYEFKEKEAEPDVGAIATEMDVIAARLEVLSASLRGL